MYIYRERETQRQTDRDRETERETETENFMYLCLIRRIPDLLKLNLTQFCHIGIRITFLFDLPDPDLC